MNSHFLDRRYRILKVLKDGEKAKTYLVEDVNLSAKKFVVKRLYFSTNNTQNLTILHRLLASKVTTLEQLGQENDQIQKQVAYFEENEEFYLVQEFIPGNPLTDEILPGQPLREDQVISLLSEILEILIVVHSRGVIHQDIKPENIIRRDSDKKLVLVDFNSINEVSSNSHHLEYTPIEQVNGNLKYNSDIYALGIVAIAALLGLSTNEISHVRNQKHRFTKEIIWHNKNLKINRKLINIINKMVRFDYRKRYQYATEVLDDLKKLTSLEHNQQNRH
ncbi:serine/threonine protein kinase, partial [Nostoc linckia z13]